MQQYNNPLEYYSFLSISSSRFGDNIQYRVYCSLLSNSPFRLKESGMEMVWGGFRKMVIIVIKSHQLLYHHHHQHHNIISSVISESSSSLVLIYSGADV